MRLNYKRTFFVGLAFMSIQAFWQLYNYVIPLILEHTFRLSEDIIGYVMAADNVLALFLLPLFGALSDKTHTRLGRRTPYILIGTVLAAALMVVVPVADWNKNFPLFVVGLGVLLLVMSTYRSPAVALMPDVTPKPLRSKANAVINLMGAIGGIFALGVITFLLPKIDVTTGEKPQSYLLVFAIIAVFMLVAALVLPLTVKENKLVAEMPPEPVEDAEKGSSGKLPRPVKKSLIFMLLSVALWYMAYNAVDSAYSRYVLDVWGVDESLGSTMMIVAMAVATISYVPIGIISSSVGRKKVILGGVIMMGVAFAAGVLFTSYTPLAYVVMGVIGIGWAAINVNSYPMVVEMSRGSDVGKYTGYYYTFSMAAQVATPILSGYLFKHFSYRVLFPYAVVFTALAFVTMLMVKHGDVKAEKKASLLENFDVDD
ncbi:MAG: MFS transporter [Clostridia bacterium]|nr:MFS transporter [Clostridia bacterium]